jgi:hypothetical protein
VVLFGGFGNSGVLGDTWTWDATTWSIPFTAQLSLSPTSGPPGTSVDVTCAGFAAKEEVTLVFVDSVKGKTVLGTLTTNAAGGLRVQVTIPPDATAGMQAIVGSGAVSGQRAKARFRVT